MSQSCLLSASGTDDVLGTFEFGRIRNINIDITMLQMRICKGRANNIEQAANLLYCTFLPLLSDEGNRRALVSGLISGNSLEGLCCSEIAIDLMLWGR